MRRLGLQSVHDKQERRDEELRSNHQSPRDPIRFEHLKTHKEVHTLVLGLLEECVDPPMVPLKLAKRAKVAEAGSEEAGHSRH